MKWWNFGFIKLGGKTAIADFSISIKFLAQSLRLNIKVSILLRTLLLNASFHSYDLEIQLNSYNHKSSPSRTLSEVFSGLCSLQMCIKLSKLAHLCRAVQGSYWVFKEPAHLLTYSSVFSSGQDFDNILRNQIYSAILSFIKLEYFLTKSFIVQRCWNYEIIVYWLFNRYDKNQTFSAFINCDVRALAEPLFVYF